MEEVVSRENMLRAYHRVVRNHGAAGFDGITVEDLWGQVQSRWVVIRDQLLSGRYVPQPVLKVEIPKPSGKGKRTLGIPTVMDRLIQQSLLQVLQPRFDLTFSDWSFGFRPRRSAQAAVLAARAHMGQGKRWVVDMDLEKFFDRVNHDVLMSRLARRIQDRRILVAIRRYLQAGMMEGGLVSPRTEGTPQGGPLSPLLSNVLLDELDKELERRGHAFVRYADDCNIYVQSKKAGERVLDSIERFLKKRLRLKVNREKSAVARPWKRKFLGYTVTHHRVPRLRVAPESVKRFREKIRVHLRRGRGRSLRQTIEAIKPLIQGWLNYFRFAEVRSAFEELDKWLRRRLRCILWRHWKKPRTRLRRLIARGLDPERAKRSAYNGRGPWWNAGASHMNQAVPTRYFTQLGLVSLVQLHQRWALLS
ncbi:MAG: group II intron reverse transcriptase/maturase [Gemmatimonadetes bacterium]|nr:group II intron reverse transcriptase/maturase [Gemmatimonadota bacterium]